jgi:hypothetical protein
MLTRSPKVLGDTLSFSKISLAWDLNPEKLMSQVTESSLELTGGNSY